MNLFIEFVWWLLILIIHTLFPPAPITLTQIFSETPYVIEWEGPLISTNVLAGFGVLVICLALLIMIKFGGD